MPRSTAQIWEQLFTSIETAWGFKPADSAVITASFFLRQYVKTVLIPGIGYGRNASPFLEKGMTVEGIELSKKAIELAKAHYPISITHGDIRHMPFTKKQFDGIYYYSVLHLLHKFERQKFIATCYQHLPSKGWMVFVVIAKTSDLYGNGKRLSTDRYLLENGLAVFFYDKNTVQHEFKNYGLVSVHEIEEPMKHLNKKTTLPCLIIKCQRL